MSITTPIHLHRPDATAITTTALQTSAARTHHIGEPSSAEMKLVSWAALVGSTAQGPSIAEHERSYIHHLPAKGPTTEGRRSPFACF